MGKHENNDVVEILDDALGLKEDVSQDENENKKSVETQEVVDTQQTDETQKSDDTPDTQTKNIVLTQQQIDINSEIAKLDVKIEELQKHTVNEDEFYENLENILSEEEAQLEFDDKIAYTKLLFQKKDEYIAQNSKEDELKELQEKRQEYASMYERQEAIAKVVAKYPQYDHETMLSFFENDLTKTQQQKIFDDAQSYEDVYETTYKEYAKRNSREIKSSTNPKIPDVNSVRKQNIKQQEIQDGLKSDDEELQEALGI